MSTWSADISPSPDDEGQQRSRKKKSITSFVMGEEALGKSTVGQDSQAPVAASSKKEKELPRGEDLIVLIGGEEGGTAMP